MEILFPEMIHPDPHTVPRLPGVVFMEKTENTLPLSGCIFRYRREENSVLRLYRRRAEDLLCQSAVTELCRRSNKADGFPVDNDDAIRIPHRRAQIVHDGKHRFAAGTVTAVAAASTSVGLCVGKIAQKRKKRSFIIHVHVGGRLVKQQNGRFLRQRHAEIRTA